MKVFIENQRFNQWWLYLILAIPLISFVIPFISKTEEVLTRNDLLEIIIPFLFLTIIYAFIFSIQLKTRIDEKGVHYQFFPFNRKLKLISWNEIENCYCRKYKPLLEYGGWGYRTTLRSGRARNIKGNLGVQIIFKNGKKLLLGTQKQDEVKMVLETYKNKIIQSKSINSI